MTLNLSDAELEAVIAYHDVMAASWKDQDHAEAGSAQISHSKRAADLRVELQRRVALGRTLDEAQAEEEGSRAEWLQALMALNTGADRVEDAPDLLQALFAHRGDLIHAACSADSYQRVCAAAQAYLRALSDVPATGTDPKTGLDRATRLQRQLRSLLAWVGMPVALGDTPLAPEEIEARQLTRIPALELTAALASDYRLGIERYREGVAREADGMENETPPSWPDPSSLDAALAIAGTPVQREVAAAFFVGSGAPTTSALWVTDRRRAHDTTKEPLSPSDIDRLFALAALGCRSEAFEFVERAVWTKTVAQLHARVAGLTESNLRVVAQKYLRLGWEIEQQVEDERARMNLTHTHSKLGMFIEYLVGMEAWRSAKRSLPVPAESAA